MQVIPVIDLMHGQVVRGVAGRRSEYRPIESRIAADCRPATVARAFVQDFGFRSVYVADLDAIINGQPDVESWQQIAAAGIRFYLDAGVGNADAAARIKEQTVRHGIDAQLVVGLESLESEQELRAIVEVCGDQRPIFSLDLKDGKPLVRNQEWHASSVELSLLAQSAGIQEIIVLDLADVGTGGGTRTLDLCRTIRAAANFQRIIAGGGVRGVNDLRALAEAGCNAAMVASALHDGLLTSEEVRQARSLSY